MSEEKKIQLASCIFLVGMIVATMCSYLLPNDCFFPVAMVFTIIAISFLAITYE